MNVETIRISGLLHDPANVRRHAEAQITKLMGMLRRWGQTLPLLIDSNDVVRVGNARLDAMTRLGWTEAKVIRLDLPPSEWTALAIADNKSHDDSEFDTTALADVLAALRAEDASLVADAGYSLDELASLIGDNSTEPPADEKPPGEFPEHDESIDTEHECPRCHYRWSGESVSKAAA